MYFFLRSRLPFCNTVFKAIMRLRKKISADNFLVFTLLAAVYLYSCSGSEWAWRVNWPDVDNANLPTEADYPGASAVILLDEGSVEVRTLSETAFSIYERHTIIKIFNSRGFRYANIAVPYGTNSEVDEIEARTIGPDGRITVLNPDKIYDVNLYPNFVFYSDQRAKIFTLPAITEGSIIEYRYQVTINSRTYGSHWRFQSELPVVKSRFKLLKQSDWEIDYRMHGDVPEPTISNLPAGFKQSMIWEAGPLPGIKSEVFMPPLTETGTRLTIAPFGISSWAELSSWYYKLVKENMDKRGELGELADSLTAHLVNDREKLRAIFEWTRDKVRYIAVEVGIGGYQPSPAEEVLYGRYGDCKDMTTLLCALADEIDIPVYQALISTRQNGIPDTTLPAATQFNHVIAYAPFTGESGLWMDATDKSCGFGALPWYDQDVPVLLITPEGNGKIVQTPSSDTSDNSTVMAWDVDLDANGAAIIDAEVTYKGIIANELRHQIRALSPSDQLEWLEIYLEELSPGASVDSFHIEDLENPDAPLRIMFNFRNNGFARVIQGMMIIEPGITVNENLHTLFQSKKRLHPVRIQIPRKSTIDLFIDLPDNWYPVRDKNSIREDTVFGSCLLSWETREKNLHIGITLTTPAQEIIPSSYKEFIGYLESIRKILSTTLVLSR